MYKGTLIQDLMAIVDSAEQKAEQQRLAEERELHEIFSMQIPLRDLVLMGAA